MTAFTIDELRIPDAVGAPGWHDFAAAVVVRNVVENEPYGGGDDMSYTADELLPGWQNQEFAPMRLFLARVDGRVVGRGVWETRPDPAYDTAFGQIQLLPEVRRIGIGTAMLAHFERAAREAGKVKLLGFAAVNEGPGERLAPPTGFGSVPAESALVRFCLASGFSLEQVVRASRLPLDADVEADRTRFTSFLDASGHGSDDYVLHRFVDRVPERWVDDMVVLHTRMSTDAPSAGLEEPEDQWSAAQVERESVEAEQSPRTHLWTVVEHAPSGRLVGYTMLSTPVESHRPASQDDTLVLREHRGHRLGMRLKAANLLHLLDVRPGHPAVTTYNAEENRHMLQVNEDLGFVATGYDAAWRKDL